jgi:nucleoside-diphosphate-sugar epimerase
MNVAIIGCGYVGKAIADYWRHELGCVVTATTTTLQHAAILQDYAQRVVVVTGNDPEGLLSVLKDQETVLLSIGAKHTSAYQETYLHTAQTLVSVLHQAPTVRHLIYTGSYAIYGDRDGAWVDESSTVAPTNECGQILAETEQVLLSAAHDNLRVCILRLGGIYGPDRELVKIYGRLSGKTCPGTGFEATNWIHLDDVVDAIEFVRAHQLQGIYNLVDDSHLTRRELLEQLFERHHLPKVIWDSSLKSHRPYNARVRNQKIKDAGYQLIHPQTQIVT